MNTLDYITSKYKLDIKGKSPIEIPGIGRNDMAVLFKELGFTQGVELGVEKGLFSEVLCKANPKAKLYMVDAWKHYRDYRDHVDGKKLEMFYESARERVRHYDTEIIREYSADAVEYFKDGQLDFVYVDANHSLPHLIQDLNVWTPKVRKGGIIAGHDYKRTNNIQNGVVQGIAAWTDVYRIHPWFLLGRKHAPEGEFRDKTRSYMWVKDRF